MSNPFAALNRKTVRGPINPMDLSTIVSIIPKDIPPEVKPTIQPGTFKIPSGTFEKPGILVVGPSSWWKDPGDEHQPLIEIPVGSVSVAQSIVKDYCNGILGCNMGDSMPGLFFLPGSHTVEDIKKNYIGELIAAQAKQKRLYEVLVVMADVLWSRSNGNPLSISDDMKLAAQELNLKDKPWLKDFNTLKMVTCKACGTLINSAIIVCPNCKVILNAEEFKKLGLSFAS